jgi:hypothetical protein
VGRHLSHRCVPDVWAGPDAGLSAGTRISVSRYAEANPSASAILAVLCFGGAMSKPPYRRSAAVGSPATLLLWVLSVKGSVRPLSRTGNAAVGVRPLEAQWPRSARCRERWSFKTTLSSWTWVCRRRGGTFGNLGPNAVWYAKRQLAPDRNSHMFRSACSSSVAGEGNRPQSIAGAREKVVQVPNE